MFTRFVVHHRPMRKRWRILLPLVLLILGCVPGPAPTADRHYLTVFGHRTILAPGSPIEMPILLRTLRANRPVIGGNIKVSLGPSVESARPLYSGRTGVDGMVKAAFTVPIDLPSPDDFLIITSDQLFGDAAFSRPVYVGVAYNVLATTDKPVYQPGQTIHIRVLALENVSLHAAAGQTVRVRVQDPNGIYLMDSPVTLSEWGVGAIDFDLDNQIPTGKYRILAAIGPKEASRTVEVKPYTLPRFGIHLTTDQRYYDIQGAIHGEVEARYFFGKPVANGRITIHGVPEHQETQTVATLAGQTDAAGHFAFDLPVPDYFFDQLTEGTEDLNLTIVVTDTAGVTQDQDESVLISAEPLTIKAAPEGGFLYPGLENIIYLEVSEPDGVPFSAALTVVAPDLGVTQTVQTDPLGLATITLTPTTTTDLPLIVTAQGAGDSTNGMVKRLSLGTIGRMTSVLVRPDRAAYQVGDAVNLDFRTTADVKTVYLDLVKDRQTVDFRTVPISDGHAQDSFALDGSLLGTLEINAYAVGKEGVLTRDRRLVLVNAAPADIEVQSDADSYQPGATAHLTLRVTQDDKPRPAALGLSIVDESVFAVGAGDPGFVRTYFMLQDELLDRRYHITGFAPFGDDAPSPTPFEGIQIAANTALMGAFAETLAATPPLAYAPPPLPSTPHDTPWSQAAALLLGWSTKLALALPLLGMALYDGRRRWRRLLFVGSVIAAGLLLWAGCSSSSPGVPAPPAPPAVDAVVVPIDLPQGTVNAETGPQAGVRIRQYFPETLFWLPEMATADDGSATLDVPLADSITTWRVSAVASTQDGVLGSTQTNLRVFQDFFIEPNLPLQLTQNDSTELSVSIYNYLDVAQTITLTVSGGDWLQIDGELPQVLALAPNAVSVARLPLRVLAAGQHELLFTAQGSHMSDAVRKPLQVVPDGRRVSATQSGILARSQDETVTLPQAALPGTARVTTRIYPSQASRFALDLPDTYDRDFCFSEDLRSIQPIALTAQYLKSIDQLAPAQQLRTERLLHRGYQRLLRYYSYVAGGFTGDCHLFFRSEPDVDASAAALVALTDLGKLVYIDPEVVQQTLAFLDVQQGSDGSWRTDSFSDWDSFFPTARVAEKDVGLTAYVVWSLGEAGYGASRIAHDGLAYVTSHLSDAADAYSQALAANALLLAAPDNDQVRPLLDGLVQRNPQNDGFSDTGALIALALVRSGRYPDAAAQAIQDLQTQLANSHSYHYSSLGRIYAIRALLLDAQRAPAQPHADLSLALNQQEVASLTITPENSQIQQSVVLPDVNAPLLPGDNTLRLRLRADAGQNYAVAYDVTTAYYVPWENVEQTTGPLSLDVQYANLAGATTVRVGDVISVNAVLTAAADRPTGQLVLELALPPGFSPIDTDWASLQDQGIVRSYQFTAAQIIVLLDGLPGRGTLTLDYRLRADLPGSVRVQPSRVYQAVAPDLASQSGAGQTLITAP